MTHAVSKISRLRSEKMALNLIHEVSMWTPFTYIVVNPPTDQVL